MKILHVVPSYLPAIRYGGPIVSVHGLCKALAARGHVVEVFTTNVDGPGNSDVPLGVPVDLDGVKVWYFPSTHLRRLFWSPSMKKALTEQVNRFDILHLHSIYLWPTWAAAVAAKAAKIPYLVAPRGMLERGLVRRKSAWAKLAWIMMVERHNLKNASALHVTSQREESEARSFGLPLPPIVVVPNGVDLKIPINSQATPSLQVCELIDRGPYLLFLGRINWKKGLDRLIVSLRQAPSVHLVVAGNDEDNYRPILDALAKSQGVIERIVFAGPVHGADKAALLQHAQALVLPSYSENFGNVVLEAMAAACPVIVTPEVGASNIVQETGSGLVVPGEPEILGAGIADILGNPRKLRQMGELGRSAVERAFSWDAIAQQMESAYLKILEGACAVSAASRSQSRD